VIPASRSPRARVLARLRQSECRAGGKRFFCLAGEALVLAFLVTLAGSMQSIAGSEDFGRCLTRKGAVFYGTSWCPHCRAQRRLLGSAMRHVQYVECSAGADRQKQASACQKAGIQGYPTWVFADGSRLGGELSLATLAAKTGCKLPGAAATGSADRTDANGVRRRKIGGALIIDIPE
jgi:glutaredoxin